MLFSYIRSLFLLSLPLIGGHIAQILIGVGDTLIVGRYSTESLARLFWVQQYFSLFLFLAQGFHLLLWLWSQRPNPKVIL